ncbi:MAG: hypothetical protein P4L96_11795 [Rhodoferax sp.]|nr:hypothetical protein [Rhodoferax sp.]
MSYDERDAAMDEFYERIGSELYPEHKQQAIEEFTAEKLRSFYIQHPDVMRPAVDAVQETRALLVAKRYAPALVFAASSAELLLKETLLRPVVYGLFHNEALAEIVVDQLFQRKTAIETYEKLLARLFETLTKIKLGDIQREGAAKTLMEEAKALQGHRNRILHRGVACTPEEAETANSVAVAIYDQIARPMLGALNLIVGERGVFEPRR